MTTAPKKKLDTTPAEAAAVEATDPDAPISFEFRSVTFTIDRAIFRSAKWVFSTVKQGTQSLIYESLGPKQSAVFISLVRPGEEWVDVSNEFMTAFNAAAGWGNS